MASWDGVEKFYFVNFFGWGTPKWFELLKRDPSEAISHEDSTAHQARFKWLEPIQDLIAAMRERGYDRQFRAGQSLYMLVLSRSREHGLRADQPGLRFALNAEGWMTAS